MNYLLEFTVCTAIFYGLYLLIFSRLTFIRLNRIYLLSSLVISICVPLISYQWEETVLINEPISETYTNNISASLLLTKELSPPNKIPITEKSFDWMMLLQIVYVSGIIFMFGKLVFFIIKMLKMSRLQNGRNYISTKGIYANSSFLNLIFIDDSTLSEPEIEQIMAHERWHIRLYHSYDLLFVEILKIAFWFNPILWLYQRSLSQVHEYEVDTHMIQTYHPQTYATLLLKLANSTQRLSPIHQFSRKPLTDRIHFLFTKQKSTPMKRLAYLSILPILGVIFMAFSVEKVVKYRVAENPDEKYFKIYKKPDAQVNNEVLVKENKVVSNLIYGENRIALTMNPNKLSMDAIVAASPYFKKIGYILEVKSFAYHNSSKQLDKFEISITENIENKKKYRIKKTDVKSDLPSKFTFDLKKMKSKGLDAIITILADRSTGEHFVSSLAPPPPPPPTRIKPALLPKVKVGFRKNMVRDSIKLIGEGELGKNPLVFINGKSYPSDVLYKINSVNISNTKTYKNEAALKKFGVANPDGAIEINTFNRSDDNLFLTEKQKNIAIENEMKRRKARFSGKSLTRITLKEFNGLEKDEVTVYKNGKHRASVTVSKGGEVLFQVGDIVKTEDEMKEISSELLGSNCSAIDSKKEIDKLGMKINNKPIEGIMKFNQ
jgi:BlaR1 peptidase M56